MSEMILHIMKYHLIDVIRRTLSLSFSAVLDREKGLYYEKMAEMVNRDYRCNRVDDNHSYCSVLAYVINYYGYRGIER